MRRALPLLAVLLSACGASVVVELDTEYVIEDGDLITYVASPEEGEVEYGELPAMCDAFGCSIRHGWDQRPGSYIDYAVWLDLDADDVLEISRIDVPEGTLPAPDWKDPATEVRVELKGASYTQKVVAELVPAGKASDPGTETTTGPGTIQ